MTKVLVSFIQDRSGSMGSVWQETLNGFKNFVQELQKGKKEEGIDYLFSLTTFDTQIDQPITAVPVDQVDLDILSHFGPRGCTALYDAVGKSIQQIDQDSYGADKIICVVVTDGQENSSREWSKDALHGSVESHLQKGNWTFTYLGTQPETWDDAGAIGVGVGAVASYTGQNAGVAYAATASAVRGLASSHQKGSRSMMVDYLSPEDERTANMHVDRGNTVSATSPSPRPTTTRMIPPAKPKSNRRWK